MVCAEETKTNQQNKIENEIIDEKKKKQKTPTNHQKIENKLIHTFTYDD